MNWEAIGAIGEIIGAGAVVVSIVYLSIQIRSNTRATRGSASYEAAHSWAQTNEQLAQLPDDVFRMVGGWYRPDIASTLSDEDHARMTLWNRSILQKLEGQYFLYRYGLLEADLWEQRRATGRGMIDPPHMRAWWENEKKIATFSHQFISTIESATPIDASLI